MAPTRRFFFKIVMQIVVDHCQTDTIIRFKSKDTSLCRKWNSISKMLVSVNDDSFSTVSHIESSVMASMLDLKNFSGDPPFFTFNQFVSDQKRRLSNRYLLLFCFEWVMARHGTSLHGAELCRVKTNITKVQYLPSLCKKTRC